MRSNRLTTVSTWCLLGFAAGLSFFLPNYLTVPMMYATPPEPPETITITGLLRDMHESHVDFNVVPEAGYGHYAGNIATSLGPDGRPVQVCRVTNFDVSGGHLVPGEPFSAEATVLGAAITSGGNNIPVTLKISADGQEIEPFGPWDCTTDQSGDVNDGNNPRNEVFTLQSIYQPGTILGVTASSWLPGGGNSIFGHQTVFANDSFDARDAQVATRVTIPTDGTVTSITAYVYGSTAGPGWDDEVRYALYADNSGEPGALLAETARLHSGAGWRWYTISLPNTAVTAGSYWLALGQDGNPQEYKYNSTGGETRVNGHDAEYSGFQANWSGTTSSTNRRVSIYATYTPDNSYTEHLTVDSNTGSPLVYVLKNGDPVPDVPAMSDQATINDFVEDYIDLDTGLMAMDINQAIYLFELGTSDPNSPAADFQDLVVLVSLASDPQYFSAGHESSEDVAAIGFKVEDQWRDSAGHPIAPHLYTPNGTDNGGHTIQDTEGTAGAIDSGGVATPESYKEWFTDIIGTNLSTTHDLVLTLSPDGVYEYLDDDFHPIDGELFGNEGASHNDNFTLAFQAVFTYDASAGQFIEFEGGDGAWLFVGTKLMLDLGGVRTGSSQYVSIDRLTLTDGQVYPISFFYAQRDPLSTTFNFRTNVHLEQGELLGAVTSQFD